MILSAYVFFLSRFFQSNHLLFKKVLLAIFLEYYPLRSSKAWANKQIKTSALCFSLMDEECFLTFPGKVRIPLKNLTCWKKSLCWKSPQAFLIPPDLKGAQLKCVKAWTLWLLYWQSLWHLSMVQMLNWDKFNFVSI